MTATYLSLSQVSAAVYATLNVSDLTTVATGGVHDVVPQNTAYPFVLFEVSEGAQYGGFGTKPGHGRLPEVNLRVYVYAQDTPTLGGMKACQTVMAIVMRLLADAPAVEGHGSWAIFWDDIVPVPDSLIAGERVNELVGNARWYVEEQ